MIPCDCCHGSGLILRFPHRCRFWPRGQDFELLPCAICDGLGVADPEPPPDMDPRKWMYRIPRGAR